VLVTTGAIRRAKLQSNQCHHHQHTNTQLFTGLMMMMLFLSLNCVTALQRNQQQATAAMNIHYVSKNCATFIFATSLVSDFIITIRNGIKYITSP